MNWDTYLPTAGRDTNRYEELWGKIQEGLRTLQGLISYIEKSSAEASEVYGLMSDLSREKGDGLKNGE